MILDFLKKDYEEHIYDIAIFYESKGYTYGWLFERIEFYKNLLIEKEIVFNHSVIALEADFTPEAISLLLALIDFNKIIVPLNYSNKDKNKKKYEISQSSLLISISDKEETTSTLFSNNDFDPLHSYYKALKETNTPGLVLFTSGTSGEPKAAVHDLSKLLEKFKVRRSAKNTLNFLLFDHWGGLNTMFHILSNYGTLISVKERTPDSVCKLIQDNNIEILPASPTFLNLLLISEAYKRYDLSSLKIITYGTEPMPQNTLNRLNQLFPNVKIQQTYGLIELGVLRAKSMSNDSLWVKVGGEGYDIRVIDGLLEIKAGSAMLGYLNADSPFTDDGYFKTGDSVEVNGEYIKILGRKSEIINVGGEKVYPQEIENVILEIENVSDVTVFKEKNAIIGNIVCANIKLKEQENKKEFIIKVKKYCKTKLQSFQVPVKIFIVEELEQNDRFKKKR